MYAGSSNLAKSNNAGGTWEVINAGNLLDGNPILSIEVSPENDNVVYAGTAPYGGQRGHLFVTQDGNSFTDVTGDLPDRFPTDITVDPTNPAVAYVVFSGFGTGHIFKTMDFGDTWEDISDNLPDVPTNAVIVDPLFPNHVYVGNDLGVFVSTVGGTAWEAYQEGLPTATMIFDLKISQPNRKLRVATHGNGAYERDLLEEVVAVEDTEERTRQLTAFPNPVQDVTTVQFKNHGTHSIQLDLLDSKGSFLKTVISESLPVGTHTIPVDLTALPSGVYFVRWTSSDQQQVIRLIKG